MRSFVWLQLSMSTSLTTVIVYYVQVLSRKSNNKKSAVKLDGIYFINGHIAVHQTFVVSEVEYRYVSKITEGDFHTVV
jgi:hypothetical protein